MEENEIKSKILELLSRPGIKSVGMHQQAIINELANQDAFEVENIKKDVVRILRSMANDSTEPIKKLPKKAGWYKHNPTHVKVNTKIGKPETDVDGNSETGKFFIGKGGEAFVMSELLFMGYNTNCMMVDDGIDLIASKNNLYYYIQVKTTYFDSNGRAHVQIRKSSFDNVYEKQVRYVIVIRRSVGVFCFFTFSQYDINRLVHDNCISNNEVISINIRYSEQDNKPYVYSGNKEQCIDWYENKFE